jgi:hypothetical protein
MRRTLAAIATLALLGALLISTPANAALVTSFELVSAQLVAKGAAVEVTYSVTCNFEQTEGGAYALIRTSISQRVGSQVTTGNAEFLSFSSEQVCTGEPEEVSLLIVPDSGSRAFRSKDALISSYFRACDDVSCPEVATGEALRLSK